MGEIIFAIVVLFIIILIAKAVSGYMDVGDKPSSGTGATASPGSVTGAYRYKDKKGRLRCYSCRKVIFVNEETAGVACSRAWSRRRKYLRPYYEPNCRYWHLSSRTPRVYA